MILHSARVGISSHWHRNFIVLTMCHISCKESKSRHPVFVLCLFLLASNHFPNQVSNSWRLYRFLLLPCSPICRKRGINIALAKRECKEAHFTHKGKRYFAIAFPNVSGGYEIRNRYFKGCIAPKKISHIRQSGTARETCYVFEGFMDYLSFLTLRLENCPKYPELERQDYMVLNSVANVSKALYPLGSYERIHCFFDNDRAGMEALQQIRMEYGRDLYIRDASQTYSECKDLNEYLQKQTERNRQVQSAKGVRSQPPKKKNGFRL